MVRLSHNNWLIGGDRFKKAQQNLLQAIINTLASVANLIGFFIIMNSKNPMPIFITVAVILVILDIDLFVYQHRHLDWDIWVTFFVIYVGTLITDKFPAWNLYVNTAVGILCFVYIFWVWRKVSQRTKSKK
ncbi:MAG: hypothetical protein LKF37_07515 [Lentilactobacillus diolivorans]|nr:hypothetical protein [Lentilactobacillus diolivorans]RRG01059.1 MAG: hypothetical protein DUD34_13430 [Lactobacillus sp.]